MRMASGHTGDERGPDVSDQEVTAIGITIVGCGPGGPECVTPEAQQAIEQAEVLVASRQVLERLPPTAAERIAVAVSGDPGVRSLARSIIRRFGRKACRVIPGISAVQVAFARLGLEWFDATLLSAHEGIPSVSAAALVGARKIAVLAGNPVSLPWLRSLGRALAASHVIVVCEDLTLPEERVRQVSAEELAELPLSSRTIVLFVHREALE